MESVKNWTRRIFMLTSLNEDQAKEVAEQVVKFIEEVIPEKVECFNCKEMVVKISTGEFCPKCMC